MTTRNQFFGSAFSAAFVAGGARGQFVESRQGAGASLPLASVDPGSRMAGNEAFAFIPHALGRALMHRV
jgi:hypothetical protein